MLVLGNHSLLRGDRNHLAPKRGPRRSRSCLALRCEGILFDSRDGKVIRQALSGLAHANLQQGIN